MLGETGVPALMPVLSRGKHRNPRKGACFMELASLLAGEPWSDHPGCTHPLVAIAARDVNDYTTDAGRHRLADLIPSVIGLTSDDPQVDVRIALRCATIALPVVSAERQRVMAVAVLTCERVLADLDGQPPGAMSARSRSAMAAVPDAARWAEWFARDMSVTLPAFLSRGAPHIVHAAVEGVARACVPSRDEALHGLLVDVIDECASLVRPDARTEAPFDAAAWAAACRRTGVPVGS